MRDSSTYGVAILLLHGPGAPTLAAMLRRRLASVARIRYAHAYLGILLAVCAWGALCFDAHRLVGTVPGLIASLPLGLAAGNLAFAADRAIVRRSWVTRATATGHSSLRQLAENAAFENGFNLWSLLSVAVLEEILFRGWYVEASRLIALPALRWAAFAVSILAFALLHLKFGWHQVIAKLPLGALGLGVVLLTGSLLAPASAHLYFNWRYWRSQNPG